MPARDFCATPLPSELTLHALLFEAQKTTQAEKREIITTSDVVGAIFRLDKSLEPFLVNLDISQEDISNVIAWQERIWSIISEPSRLTNPHSLRLGGGIGKDWASGYTNFLNQFAHELNELVDSPIYEHQFIAHAPQIDEIERVLSRSGRHNALLVGETGVGKRTTVLGFTRRVLLGTTLSPLRFKRVLELDVSALLSNASNPDELESRLIRVLNEAVKAGNVILYIDDIDRLLTSSGDTLGTINAADILIPYLESPSLQLLGTISPPVFYSVIERYPSLAANFEKIEILEPNEQQTIRILQEVVPAFESRYSITISYQAMREVIRQATRYVPNRKFPEKAIELLDEICVEAVSRKGAKTLTTELVDEVISQKMNIPVGNAEASEKDRLLHLEDLLHEKVVNQVTAISAIANALRRSRAGVGSEKKPIGTFLFLGPTGVGKTETAKALSEIYFGNQDSMIRFDMSEFQDPSSIRQLLGDASLNESGRLTTAIREKPFTCLLLDELEKAHPKILDIFLQVLDEGRLTDALGQVADFRNAIIIATSNAGAQWLRQQIESKLVESNGQEPNIDMEVISKQLLDEVQNQNIFKPEFLNRFDAVVAYRPLTATELEKVVDLQLASLNKRLAPKQITVTINEAARTRLAKLGFDPVFGARALSRTMVELVENQVASALLKDELKKGGAFEVTEEMIQLKVHNA